MQVDGHGGATGNGYSAPARVANALVGDGAVRCPCAHGEKGGLASQCGCQWVQLGGVDVCGCRQGVKLWHGSLLLVLALICIFKLLVLIYLGRQTSPKWKCETTMSFSHAKIIGLAFFRF